MFNTVGALKREEGRKRRRKERMEEQRNRVGVGRKKNRI